ALPRHRWPRWIESATLFTSSVSSFEDHSGFQHQYLADRDQAGSEHDQQHRCAGQRHDPRRHPESRRYRLDRYGHDDAEQCRPTHAEAVADRANEGGLQKAHADEADVADAHCLERAELLEVLDGEHVKRLPGDGGADNESQGHRDAEVDWNPG